MSRFQFSLESVLKVREQTRDECRQQLGAAIRHVQELESQHQSVLQEQDELKTYLRELSNHGSLDIGLISRCNLHLSQLEQQQHEALFACKQARDAVHLQRLQLINADRQVKALEKLREKQFDEFSHRLLLEEIREQEESLAAQALRNRRL